VARDTNRLGFASKQEMQPEICHIHQAIAQSNVSFLPGNHLIRSTAVSLARHHCPEYKESVRVVGFE
jgi:hypothetical protein